MGWGESVGCESRVREWGESRVNNWGKSAVSEKAEEELSVYEVGASE